MPQLLLLDLMEGCQRPPPAETGLGVSPQIDPTLVESLHLSSALMAWPRPLSSPCLD
jgi:hypothetical protein